MLKFEIKPTLLKTLKKIKKKDQKAYSNVLSKIKEITQSNKETISNYKNLRKLLQHLKKVHINTHFVLLFNYIPNEKKIIFEHYKHHDEAYR